MLDGAPPGGLGERLLALRGFSLLAALPAAELALVARLSRERDLSPGETLAVEGESVQTVRLIVSGQVTLSRAGRPMPGVGALETVGLLALAAGLPHPFTAVAADAVHALEIDAELVAEVLEDDFGLFARVLQLGANAALAATARATPRDLAADAGRWGKQRTTIAGSPRPALPPIDVAETLLALRATTWFRAVPLDALAALAKRLELVQLRTGAELAAPNGAGDLLLLVAGRARTAAGELAPGAALGVLETLADTSPPMPLRALSPVQLLRASASDLFDVLEDHPAMGRALLAEMLRVIAG